MIRTLFEAEIPIVTGVQGYAAGIGNTLALVGDHVVAARSAQFWVPFVARGFTPDSGTTFLLPRLIGVARSQGDDPARHAGRRRTRGGLGPARR